MAGKHSQKSSNTSLIVLIIVAVVLVSALVGGAIFFMNGGLSKPGQQETTSSVASTAGDVTTEVSTQSAVGTEANSSQNETVSQTSTGEYTSHEESNTHMDDEPIDIAVPTDAGVEVRYFNATYIPNGKVVDNETGSSATLREVFGTGYHDGVLTFNNDGTFKDSLISNEANRGAYVVQDKTIHATYSNDKNMRIEVTEWDGDTPAAFQILYGNYTVYFG